jgi:peptide/nickel transport system permease protein
MLKYIAKRLLSSTLILIGISIVTFGIYWVLPVNPAAIACGVHCTPQKIAANEHLLGLDVPIQVQYGRYVKGIFTGAKYDDGQISCPAPSFGYSQPNQACVSTLIGQRFPVTLSLALGAFILWMLIGVPLGIVAARYRGRWPDRLANIFVLTGTSVPTFLLGIVIYIFVITVHLVDPINQGLWASPITQPFTFIHNFIFAWITLAVTSAAIYTRLTRSNVIETSSEDFIRTARAKGVSEWKILLKHNLRTALAPIITQAGLDFGGLLGGAIITEVIFQLQGLGNLGITAVLQTYDQPVLVATILLAAFFILIFNLIVDVLYGVLDPRVRIA